MAQIQTNMARLQEQSNMYNVFKRAVDTDRNSNMYSAVSFLFFFNGTNPMVHMASTMYSFCTKQANTVSLVESFPDHCRNSYLPFRRFNLFYDLEK